MKPVALLSFTAPSLFDATVIIAGISIVVGVLILLIFVFYLFGLIVSKAESRASSRKNKKKSLEDEGTTTVKATPISEIRPPVKPDASAAENGISGEVVAAIAAAVAQTEGANAVVRSIKKKNVSGRNPWAQAAAVDNTRPF